MRRGWGRVRGVVGVRRRDRRRSRPGGGVSHVVWGRRKGWDCVKEDTYYWKAVCDASDCFEEGRGDAADDGEAFGGFVDCV